MLIFSISASRDKIDSAKGIIYGVSVVCVGEAKGHNVFLDGKSLDTFLAVAGNHPNGIKVRFGNDHKAGIEDTAAILKNFRREEDCIRADMHILDSESNRSKILEMAEKMPDEFGLSVYSDAKKEKIGNREFIRFNDVPMVDLVSDPAATNGLFFSKPNSNQNIMRTKMEQYLGLSAEDASKLSDDQIYEQFEAKHKEEAKKCMDAEAKKKMKKKDEDDEDEKSEKFSAAVESLKTEFSKQIVELTTKVAGFEEKAKQAADAGKKAEVESLKLEASREGKVIPLSDEALLKLDVPTIKDMISKLSKGQVKLSKGPEKPKDERGRELDYHSEGFRSFMAERRQQNEISLGNKMIAQLNN